MSLQDNAKNALLTGGVLSPLGTNQPEQYESRERRYFERGTRTFDEKMGMYAPDCFSGTAQGIYGKAEEWTPIRFRMADVVRPSASITRKFDDFKTILIFYPRIDYLMPGTKIRSMGSTWLAVNASNISSPVGNGIIRRCNAVWNHLDFYGNVLSEPICVENLRANSNDPDSQESGMITKGYFNIIAQCNAATRQLDTNSRLILGSGAYKVTGYSDFQTEFTDDVSTVRLLEFAVRYEEPNEAIDDMERRVAGGKTFVWSIDAPEIPNMTPGQTEFILPESWRNGARVTTSEAQPISYLFSSSDESIASVAEDGSVTAIAPGECQITVTLAQNPQYQTVLPITVAQPSVEPNIRFVSAIPDDLEAYESAEIEAAYFLGETQTSDTVAWSFSGADSSAYTVEISGNKARISCWAGSIAPLRVKASFGGAQAQSEIALKGL